MEKKPKAVALDYERSKDAAPRVVAKGQGEVAKNIIRLAKEGGIPIKEDPDLVELLSKVEIDREIPPSLYKAVAEIFGFIYRITNDKRS